MGVRGNVVSCDICGQQIGMPTAMKHAGRRDMEDAIRAYAVGWGWVQSDQGDSCPEHQQELAALEADGRRQPADNVAPVRRVLGAASRLLGST
jgi:hypothetical protein